MKAVSLVSIAGLLFFALGAKADPIVRTVNPAVTGAGIARATSLHQVVLDPWVSRRGSLVLTIGGTGSTTTEFSFVQQVAAAAGYHVLGLDYPNQVISTVCQKRTEPSCFDDYRAEIITGVDVSPLVSVNRTNSILNRTVRLIEHLATTHPKEGWSQYLLPDGSLDWSRIVLIGHSQGAGHVAYISKMFTVQGIVMMSGPHDKYVGGLANWVLVPGKTPVDRLFAFFHAQDFFGCDLQVEVARGMISDPDAKLERIAREIPMSSDAQIFITDVPAADPHNSLAKAEFVNVWKSLLSRF